MDVLCKEIKEIEDNIMEILSIHKEFEMTNEDIKDFKDATR